MAPYLHNCLFIFVYSIQLSLSILPFQNIARKLYVPAAQSALNMLHVDIIVLPVQILEAILLGLALLVAS